ncbi:hypothetical protein ALC57_12411 [Trachymyrmex cornetzi]|uniref:Uncharacterized protein n=1 Tax=Trachymyrmex cornetzi TaxID=471704 RepID=A0A195DRC6_9HYME|nr:hypothetical protein ALC57_12411 [Trachymyrmex cornetzi]
MHHHAGKNKFRRASRGTKSVRVKEGGKRRGLSPHCIARERAYSLRRTRHTGDRVFPARTHVREPV